MPVQATSPACVPIPSVAEVPDDIDLAITASASFAHDIYASVIHKGQAPEGSEVRVARITALVVGTVAILGGIAANGQNIAFLVALAFAVAASANLPTILYSLFWKRFNTRGCLWSIYGGLLITVTLIAFSPAVSGDKAPMFPNSDWSWFPLANPGIISIPASFLLGFVGRHEQEASGEQVRRDGGPFAHRRGRGRRRSSDRTTTVPATGMTRSPDRRGELRRPRGNGDPARRTSRDRSAVAAIPARCCHPSGPAHRPVSYIPW